MTGRKSRHYQALKTEKSVSASVILVSWGDCSVRRFQLAAMCRFLPLPDASY
ncbi:MAG: hypothetical protein V7739_01190 [Motiliproteus sp.]